MSLTGLAKQSPQHSQDSGASAWLVDSGKRLHLQHGPIDLIVECDGTDVQVMSAYRRASKAFVDVLQTLADELPVLRTGSWDRSAGVRDVRGPVAIHMMAAIQPFRAIWLSPMIAVAGAVADHILAHAYQGGELDRVMINNGGDIALQLNADKTCTIGICPDASTGRVRDTLTLDASSGVGGVATSGWRGRSFSLGVADAVTILAADAATADVAATLVANAVNIADAPEVKRTCARELSPDSDLGNRLVTTHVASLSDNQRRSALNSGADLALRFHREGLITAAYLHLQGETQLIGQNLNLAGDKSG